MNPLIYALIIYSLFYLANEATIFNRPRAWLFGHLTKWQTNMITCAFCFTFWLGVLWTIYVDIFTFDLTNFSVNVLLVAPIINHIIHRLMKYIQINRTNYTQS